jgi:hypothetical protein
VPSLEKCHLERNNSSNGNNSPQLPKFCSMLCLIAVLSLIHMHPTYYPTFKSSGMRDFLSLAQLIGCACARHVAFCRLVTLTRALSRTCSCMIDCSSFSGMYFQIHHHMSMTNSETNFSADKRDFASAVASICVTALLKTFPGSF